VDVVDVVALMVVVRLTMVPASSATRSAICLGTVLKEGAMLASSAANQAIFRASALKAAAAEVDEVDEVDAVDVEDVVGDEEEVVVVPVTSAIRKDTELSIARINLPPFCICLCK